MEEGNTVDNFKVIRHKDCSLICSEVCCDSCTIYHTAGIGIREKE